MNKTEKIIERVDSYISLLRYNYSTQEKLSRLHVIQDYYKSMDNIASNEKLKSSIELGEQLEKGLILPLKVRGIFLSEGRPKRRYYTADELEIAVNNPLNSSFPLMLDHADKLAGKVIGMVDNIKYDAKVRGIRWWGHINDETFARNVIDKAITDVSTTVFSNEEYDEVLGIVGKDLTFKELSLVLKGADPKNYIEAY